MTGSSAVTSPPGLVRHDVSPSSLVTWSTGSRLATTTKLDGVGVVTPPPYGPGASAGSRQGSTTIYTTAETGPQSGGGHQLALLVSRLTRLEGDRQYVGDIGDGVNGELLAHLGRQVVQVRLVALGHDDRRQPRSVRRQ
jgi:hypothetical protein